MSMELLVTCPTSRPSGEERHLDLIWGNSLVFRFLLIMTVICLLMAKPWQALCPKWINAWKKQAAVRYIRTCSELRWVQGLVPEWWLTAGYWPETTVAAATSGLCGIRNIPKWSRKKVSASGLSGEYIRNWPERMLLLWLPKIYMILPKGLQREISRLLSGVLTNWERWPVMLSSVHWILLMAW